MEEKAKAVDILLTCVLGYMQANALQMENADIATDGDNLRVMVYARPFMPAELPDREVSGD
jgi:hypothetical protein